MRSPELSKSETESRIRGVGLGGEGSRELVFGDRVWDDDEALGTAVVTGARPRERTCSLPVNCRRGLRNAVCSLWA